MVNDLALINGTVIDPGSELNAPRNVMIHGDRIAAVLEPGEPFQTRQSIDCSGQLVVPGLIDFHVHVFPGVSHFGVEADETCLSRGVTTVLDLGTAGGLIFDGFRRYVVDASRTRVKALVNIAGQGLISSNFTKPALGELWDLAYCDVDGCVEAIERHRDCVVGVKVRCMDTISKGGQNELAALKLARQAADAAAVPLVVHPAKSSLAIEQILGMLRAGDVLTHCYHSHSCSLVDGEMRVWPIVYEKQQAGVLLDVGHGMGSFAFRVARTMLDQGVLPDFIGSDLHSYNLHGPVFDLATTMDKFLHLGMPVPEIIRRCTSNCARFLRLGEEIGTLKAGACADVSVLEIKDGRFPLTDCEGTVEIGQRSFQVRRCLRAGRNVEIRSCARSK